MYARDWESKLRLNLTQRVTGSLVYYKPVIIFLYPNQSISIIAILYSLALLQ